MNSGRAQLLLEQRVFSSFFSILVKATVALKPLNIDYIYILALFIIVLKNTSLYTFFFLQKKIFYNILKMYIKRDDDDDDLLFTGEFSCLLKGCPVTAITGHQTQLPCVLWRGDCAPFCSQRRHASSYSSSSSRVAAFFLVFIRIFCLCFISGSRWAVEYGEEQRKTLTSRPIVNNSNFR